MSDTLAFDDVMCGKERITINVDGTPLHGGFVSLVDTMPRLVPVGKTADYAITQAARVSYGSGTKTVTGDIGLTRYLLRHKHTTPFEMVEFKFHCKMPIFVARQWVRHRTANINEYSGRYSVMSEDFYKPNIGDVQMQSTSNNQGGETPASVEDATTFLSYLDVAENQYKEYKKLIDMGISREQARMGLAVNNYTEWYWKVDLHNLFHFLKLRMDAHAQIEIRRYATAMFDLIKPIVPIACKAFTDYYLESVTLTRLEVESLRTGKALKTKNKRETKEWLDKKKELGIDNSSSNARENLIMESELLNLNESLTSANDRIYKLERILHSVGHPNALDDIKNE